MQFRFANQNISSAELRQNFNQLLKEHRKLLRAKRLSDKRKPRTLEKTPADEIGTLIRLLGISKEICKARKTNVNVEALILLLWGSQKAFFSKHDFDRQFHKHCLNWRSSISVLSRLEYIAKLNPSVKKCRQYHLTVDGGKIKMRIHFLTQLPV